MLVGHAHTLSSDQSSVLQTDALPMTGCRRTFTEKVGGPHHDGPQPHPERVFRREWISHVQWTLSLLTHPHSQAVKIAADKGQGRRGGKQRAIEGGKFRLVESLLADAENQISAGNAISQLKVGRTAFCRYFPLNRIWQFKNEQAHSHILRNFRHLCVDDPWLL